MILPHGIKIMLCLPPTDMRCGFDGLSNRVRNELGGDPLDGSLFVFRGRSRTRVKILYWDKDGLAVWSKRLEKGTFKFPTVADTAGSRLTISAADLAMLLDGVDLDRIKRGKRFSLPASGSAAKKP